MNDEDDLYDAKLLKQNSLLTQCSGSPEALEFHSAEDAKTTRKDSGWAWVVCGAAFCDLFVVLGMHYSVGVLYAALLDHFRQSKANTGKLLRGNVLYCDDQTSHSS